LKTNVIENLGSPFYNGLSEIAVDNSGGSTKGDLYVDSYFNIVVYDSETGAMLGELNGGVTGLENPCGVAVDASGHVYASFEKRTVNRYAPAQGAVVATGADYTSSLWGFGDLSCNLAADSSGNVYINSWPSGPVRKYEASQFNTTGQAAVGAVFDNQSSTLAVDFLTGEVYVDEQSAVTRFDSSGKVVASTAGDFPGMSGLFGVAVDGAIGASYVGIEGTEGTSKIGVLGAGALPATPVTKPASGVTATTAVLHGELEPKGSELGFYFSYNTGSSCTGAGRTTTPLDNGGAPVSGSSPVDVSASITGLVPSTHYTFCVFAENAFGAGEGSAEPFTTSSLAPVVDSESASGITPFVATLEAQVNPEKEETTCTFEYGPTNLYGTSVPCTPKDLGSGYGDQQATTSLSGLKPGSVYHYRVLVKNATGVTEGEDKELTTLEAFAPFIDSESASEPGSPTLSMQALINPDYQETTYSFQYATNETLTGATTVPGGTLPAGFGDQPASVNLGNSLAPDLYYYRAVAENATGSTEGPVQSFARTARPVIGVMEAQNATTSTVQLSGTVNPQGIDTTYRFKMVSEAAYQAALAGSAEDPYTAGPSTRTTDIGSDYTAHATGEVVARELLPGTTYHYALVATNQKGTTIGPDGTFTTGKPTPPPIATGGASSVTQNTATITGTVNTEGLPTAYGFEIGLEAGNYGPPTGLGSVGAGASEAEVILALTGLQPGTAYHYRITATNGDGTSYGTDRSFTTSTFTNAFVVPPAPLPFVTVPAIVFPTEEEGTRGVTTRALTRAQKLANALKGCHKKPKSKRGSCERSARRKYGPVKKKK
jgi:hypothetical protein